MELPKYHKSLTIYNWKRHGVIYHDFDELYEVYIKTMKCQHCNKEFKITKDRHLDHDHNTGLFRKIVCNGCNNQDRYIKYPNGYDRNLREKKYREKNREKINEKISCDCGVNFSRSNKSKHETSMKHLDWFMNNVD